MNLTFNLVVGLIFVFLTSVILYKRQLYFKQLLPSWFVLTALFVYGYVPPILFYFYGQESIVNSINGLSWVLDISDIANVLSTFNVLVLSLFLVEIIKIAIYNKYSRRDFHERSNMEKKLIISFWLVFLLTALSFYLRYGGISGYLNFLGFSLRRDAYAEGIIEGGILARFDIFALMLFSNGLYCYYEKTKFHIYLLILSTLGLCLLTISGSRLPVFIGIFIWFYISSIYVVNLKKILIRGGFLLVLLIPLSTLWGVARNSGWDSLEYSEYHSFLSIIPSEVYSVYFSSTSYVPKGDLASFFSMFFPEKIANIFNYQKISLSTELNTYLRGSSAAAVYIAPISTWILYPFGNNQIAILILSMMIFIFYSVILFYSKKLYYNWLITPVFIGFIFYIIRLDPGAWSSRFTQLFLLYAIIAISSTMVYKFGSKARL